MAKSHRPLDPAVDACLRRIAMSGADTAIGAAGVYIMLHKPDMSEDEQRRVAEEIVRQTRTRMATIAPELVRRVKARDMDGASVLFLNTMCLTGVSAAMKELGHTGDAKEAADNAAAQLSQRMRAIFYE